ncbi:hypothetical protein G7Y89_g626 [Cudoniella acicularis]|uniref:Uncharacterized protein n=1 Tax=Cudoniella acicularis TaxID=354080 RepID=A0A8H4RZL6_9HELO|nr:hypothetical protein G7Y89_g626 [Cudoniella acicularis]
MLTQSRLQTGPVVTTPSPSLPAWKPDFSFDKSDDGSEKSPQSTTSTQNLLQKPWPARPQPLQKGLAGWRWWDSTLDLVMLMLPLPFLVLVAATIVVDGKAVDDSQSTLLDHSIKGATTIFPIFFAATTGRAAVKYATWKLEQGTTLGVLEQLMGSRTVASTFTTQVQLRSFNVIGFVLLLVWSLSPIGSQSVLHILTTPERARSSSTSISYINSRQQSYATPTGAFQQRWFSGFSVLFGSSLLATTAVKEGSMDSWGNVKIPRISSVLASGVQPDAESGWAQIPTSNFTPTYSSLFGIPVSGLGIGSTIFNLESTYLELTCGNMTLTPVSGNGSKSQNISIDGPFVSFANVDIGANFAIGYKGPDVLAISADAANGASYLAPKFCSDCIQANLGNRTIDPGIILFEEYDGLDNITGISCSANQQYVESSISCTKTSNSQSCQVTAQRFSILPHQQSSITPLSFPQVALGLTALMPNITSQTLNVNLIENFLYDPDSVAAIITGQSSTTFVHGETPLLEVSPEEFADRFGQLLNAFVYGSMWNSTPYIIGSPFDGILATPVGGNNASFVMATTEADLEAMVLNQTAVFTVPASLTTNPQVYFVFYPWLVTFFLCTVVMLLAAIVGVYYSRRTIVPDYLGYVSSLAKESPYIRMPDVGVNMDGMDKARLVKDVKVRLGDVSDLEDTRGQFGRLAFARMEETKTVKKGKLYI